MREAERLNSLVAILLEYGRPEPVRLAPANPDDVWVRVLADHRGELEAKALLARHTPAEPLIVCDVDPDQLGHAFSNALANAIDAAPEGTDLAILSSPVPTAPGSPASETTDRPSRRRLSRTLSIRSSARKPAIPGSASPSRTASSATTVARSRSRARRAMAPL